MSSVLRLWALQSSRSQPWEPLHLSLPEEPVNVNFSKMGTTFPMVALCSVDTGAHSCEQNYTHRMRWNSSSVTMLNVTSDDEGNYTVIFSKNCVISSAYRVNINPDNYHTHYYVLIPTFIFIIISVLCVLCVIKNKEKLKDIMKIISSPCRGTQQSLNGPVAYQSPDSIIMEDWTGVTINQFASEIRSKRLRRFENPNPIKIMREICRKSARSPQNDIGIDNL